MDETNIQIIGDSILQGVQVNPENKKYYVKNEIDFVSLEEEFHCTVKNNAKFGCTVTKGAKILDKLISKGLECSAVIMDFGGNDCDFIWSDVADSPHNEWLPKIPLNEFLEEYRKIIHTLKERGIIPILCSLPPLEPQRFFDWWCRDLNKKNVLSFLGEIRTIYNHQEKYSNAVIELAREENVPLIDIRSEFMKEDDIGKLICEDGTHPNSDGQKVITRAIEMFMQSEKALLFQN